nr:Ycf54 [Erythrotrichia welwitschii]
MNTYYFAIASRKFLTEEEPLEEILRERVSYYNSSNKPIDFWFIETPDFFKTPQLKEIIGEDDQPFAAVVSTNRTFINWLKLRVGYVAVGRLGQSDFVVNNLLENIVTTQL